MPEGRTAACSSRCRAARSRRQRVEAIRKALQAALALVDDLHRARRGRSGRP